MEFIVKYDVCFKLCIIIEIISIFNILVFFNKKIYNIVGDINGRKKNG